MGLRSRFTDLSKRAPFYLVFVALLALIIATIDQAISRIAFVTLCFAMASIAIYEYFKIFNLLIRKRELGLVIIALLVALLPYFASSYSTGGSFLFWVILIEGLLWLLIVSAFSKILGAANMIGHALVSFFYIALPFVMICDLLIGPSLSNGDPRGWFCFLIIATKATDIGGYFIGKAFGKKKLAKSLSPKKTIEGALGGTLLAFLLSLGFTEYFAPYVGMSLPLTVPEIFFISVALSIFAQIGDLSESLLKRDAGVKDSNRLPAIGGALDTMDSLLLTIPALWIYLKFSTHI